MVDDLDFWPLQHHSLDNINFVTPSGCSVIVIYFTPSCCSAIDSYCSNSYREKLVSSSVSAGLSVNDLLTLELCTHLSGEPFLNAVEVTQSVIGAYASIHESSRSANFKRKLQAITK